MSSIAVSHMAFATETDQFTTPPAPLYDMGPALSRKVVGIVESDRTGKDPERILAGWVGRSILKSRLTIWVKGFQAEAPVDFRPPVHDSIYRIALSPAPGSFAFDSPTVSLHGFYMGTDKIDHFFRQGWEYFELVKKKEAKGFETASAIAAAVAHGVKQEHTYFGTLASGVYSNGDLAANYAGMKFYLNLQQPVRIGERELPPIFERTSYGWKLRPGIDPDHLLDPFLSNHFDESLNPSRYKFSRGSIRSVIRNRCDQWKRFYSDRLDLVAPSGRSFATTWFGEDYGHWLPPEDEVSIATECEVPGQRSWAELRTPTSKIRPTAKKNPLRPRSP
jgi:hypothetical protein